MPRVAKKKFEIKPIPQLTFVQRVQNAFHDMGEKLGENCCIIGACINLNERTQNFLNVATFHDFPKESESALHVAAIPVADIIWRMAQGWNVDVDEVLAEIKVWLDYYMSKEEE